MSRELRMRAKTQKRKMRQYHIACGPGDVAEYVLLPGAPERVDLISAEWDARREVAFHREFKTHTGMYKGVSLSATSSGIGGPSLAIAVQELAAVGASTFVRVGSCGAIQPEIECGDLVISSAAVRMDGTSDQYVLPSYPAVSSYEVLLALVEAAEGLDVPYHVGISASTADFYAGQARDSFGGYHRSVQDSLIGDLQAAKVLGFEMEASCLFALAGIFGLRSGSVCAVYVNRVEGLFKPGAGESDCINVANEAVKILAEWDALKRRRHKKHWHPSLPRNLGPRRK